MDFLFFMRPVIMDIYSVMAISESEKVLCKLNWNTYIADNKKSYPDKKCHKFVKLMTWFLGLGFWQKMSQICQINDSLSIQGFVS